MRREGSQLQQLYKSLYNIQGDGARINEVLLNDRNEPLCQDILVAELRFRYVGIGFQQVLKGVESLFKEPLSLAMLSQHRASFHAMYYVRDDRAYFLNNSSPRKHRA